MDLDALVYMMVANEMLHQVLPSIITIAEDVSGMPGEFPCRMYAYN